MSLSAQHNNSLVAPRCRVIDPILQRSLCVREALRATSKPHTLANVVPSLLAPLARLAWQTDFQRYFISNTEVLNL